MGRRGPPGKAPEIEAAQGYPGRRKRKTKAEIEATSAAAEDMQDDAPDSSFVPPPPPWLLSKRARAIWAEKFADPATRIWFKLSDHTFIARYCATQARWEQIDKRNPKPTYNTTSTVGGKVIKRNPLFDQMMALSRELRAMEQQLAGNPVARADMEKRLPSGGSKGMPGSRDRPKNDPAQPPPGGPLGALKAPARLQ